MTPISKTLEELINEIYQDGNVSIAEYKALRDDADLRMNAVVQAFGQHNNVTAFQKAVDVTMQLLQTSVIDAKKARLNDTGEAIVRDAVTAQVEYLRAGSQLALRLL
ncbi:MULTISPECIES: hypothetical protein [Pseudomonas]|uniref:Uncharacterized protein n=1 Tax=Pseudomonas monachiensis TaxID=3060212 RepID=A0ABW9H610_9PSED|nr:MULTISPECIES: hypothetical protein [unclassified Pseudomonas]KRA94399.1 hypothetical protein ASD91_11760 [Pseudomonas sp. Root68]KRB65993.1 hypothetical protein ASD95_11065 [Pseudomonas sp. Root71]